MVEHRKYLPQELDYVLSRVAAGWRFEIIAKAFKEDFASHWADRVFTKKQVQYIKNTYKRPPGIIQPYRGPVPVFMSSPAPTFQNPTANRQATMNAALQSDQYGQNDPEGRSQAYNTTTQHTHAATQPSVVDPGCQGHQYLDDGGMFTDGPESPYDFNTILGTSSDRHPTTVDNVLDPMSEIYAGRPPNGEIENYQPEVLAGIGTQFPQIPQWTQDAPGPSTHPRFSGYASQLDTSPIQGVPSLQNTLLNSAAPDHVLSGEHTKRLLQGPAPRLERLSYGPGPAAVGPARTEIPTTIPSAVQDERRHADSLQHPLGCSVDATAYTDRSGWWYNGYHDGWCRIAYEHRHNYDGGVYFSNYISYTQNIRTAQNDHVTGFMLGLCHQLQTQPPESEATCLHQSCEEARRVAQQLVDASLPEGHDLRQAPLSQPHPLVIRLLHDLNDRLPDGYVYDPLSQRVLQHEVPIMGKPLVRNDPVNPVDGEAVQKNDGQ
ncbi:hypothetical protein N0V93_001839 [Gnomoniopsis smithogilvyi]|uniref:Uncharacterized protein n=1 Tax=Gnomoniopsis smithogilvyi TaxID=1191159 RepID=A0A9W8Z4B5_9PEZI|nr:hypothetical protein N0V93_001839 [Gnomoniopsis smithogilvyi]